MVSQKLNVYLWDFLQLLGPCSHLVLCHLTPLIPTFQCVQNLQSSILEGLAILSIEKDAVHQLKSTATFYDDVITEFTKQERRMDFTFK